MELSSYKLINLDGTIFGIKKIETNLNPFQHKCLDRLDQISGDFDIYLWNLRVVFYNTLNGSVWRETAL